MTDCSLPSGLALTFHGVQYGETTNHKTSNDLTCRYTVTHDRFAQAIDLFEAGKCCTASEFANKSTCGWRLLTFDDGNASDYAVVLPMLVERKLRATFFVTTDNVDRPGYTSAAELREMVSKGMEVGSHGLTHQYLVGRTRSDAIQEIRVSKERLEQAIGVEVTSFAPVGGHYHKWMLTAAAEAGYRVFAIMAPGQTRVESEFVVLRRNHIQSHHDSEYVSRLLRAHGPTMVANCLRYSILKLAKTLLGMRNYDRLRQCTLGTILRVSSRHSSF